MDDKTEAPLIESYREQLIDFKKELAAVFEELLAIGLDDKDELFAQHTALEKLQFGCSHKARQLIGSHHHTCCGRKGSQAPQARHPIL